jgi:uncharacterized protein YwqG
MTKNDIQQWFQEKGLADKWKYFEPLVRNSIRINLERENEKKLALGQSKIGGLPDLPKNENWFTWQEKSLSFIAQINFSEIKPFDLENQLPATGIAYFFYHAEQETWGFDPEDRGSFKVFYYSGDESDLERKDAPDDLERQSVFNACRLTFKSELNLPYWEYGNITTILSSEQVDIYIEICNKLYDDSGMVNKLLGHSDNIQSEMETECELVTNGMSHNDLIGTYNEAQRARLLQNYGLWRLLLQIDSNEEDAGMTWGDVGRLYFWIRENNLQSRDFENSWMILQCY